MDLNEEWFTIDEKSTDLENTLMFLNRLPSNINFLINKDKSNFLIYCLPESQEPEVTPELFLSAFDEIATDYKYYFNEIEEYLYPNSSELKQLRHRQVTRELNRIGFTNKNLKLKASLLNKLWNRVSNSIESTGNKIINFAKNKTIKLVRDFLNYLNSILGSLKEVFLGIEALKEFKEIIENYLVLAE